MGFFAYQGLDHSEIDLQINHQIDLFIEAVVDKYYGRELKIGVKEGFQEDVARLDNLRTLHVKNASVSLTTNPDGSTFPLPTDYSHHIKTKVIASYTCVDVTTNVNSGVTKKTITNTLTNQVRIGESENMENMRNHPFYKTRKESPLGEIANNIIQIYTDSSFNITQAFVDYIKKPAVVAYVEDINGNYDPLNSVTCDLPHTVHRIIVNMTVIAISKIIESNPQKIQNLEKEVV